MRTFRQANYINVYFLTDAQKVRDEETTLDINDARRRFDRKLEKERKESTESGQVVMRFASGDVIRTAPVIPAQVRLASALDEFNAKFGKL
jgi:hypothetical protein